MNKVKNKQDEIWSTSLKLILKMTVIALFSALALALKIAFAFLPNIEFVTFILMFSTVFFRLEIGFGIINVYCTLNMLYFGIADWSIMYFIIFNCYGIVSFICRPLIYKWWWIVIILCALMGYLFGTFYALQTIILYGPNVALAYWINGFIFDAIHGTSNGAICALVYLPVYKLMITLYPKWPYLFNRSFRKYYKTLKLVELVPLELNEHEKIPVE